jgi:hypothetical protein
MSNLTNNRINATATAAQITAVKSAIQSVNTNLPFLIGLTTSERIALPAINVNNKAFTEDAINAMVNNPTLAPSYLSVPNMQTDLTLFTQLDELIIIVKQLLERKLPVVAMVRRPEQQEWLDAVQSAGGIAVVARSVEDALRITTADG